MLGFIIFVQLSTNLASNVIPPAYAFMDAFKMKHKTAVNKCRGINETQRVRRKGAKKDFILFKYDPQNIQSLNFLFVLIYFYELGANDVTLVSP